MPAPAARKGLSTRTIAALIDARQPGLWAHRAGLALSISKAGSPAWTFRYTVKGGARRLMTLRPINPLEPITAADLKALEIEAEGLKLTVRRGADPLQERQVEQDKSTINRTEGETFEQIAKQYINEHEPNWRNDKHRQQWTNTLVTYVYPFIGKKLPHEITTDDVLSVLRQDHTRNGQTGPLYKSARETAIRVRSRIQIVIGAAKAKGLHNPATRERWAGHHNPAAWADNLEHWLAGKKNKAKSHFAAMDWKDVPGFVAALSGKADFSARALLLTILCATRTSETLNATWTEFDLEAGIWTIPAERMKAGFEHRVPLSEAAIDLLKRLHRIEGNPYVFPGAKRNRPLSNMAMLEMLRGMRPGNTVHGFRSCFRDWAAETTLHPDTIVEMALAHTIKDKTVAAYRRGDAFERRKNLMEQWASYLLNEPEEYKIEWSKFLA